MDKKRITYLDIVKGISILAIIAGHMGISDINRVVFTFHVPAFYMISGYFLNPNEPLNRLVPKKARQLLLPYGLTCAAICLLSILRNLLLSPEQWLSELKQWVLASLYGAGDTWEKPFHIRGIGAIWFLLALFFGILLAWYTLQDLPRRWIAAVALGYLGIVSVKWIWLPLSIQAGAVAAMYILAGYVCRKYQLWDNKPALLSAILASAVWFLSMRYFNGFWLVHNYFGSGVLDLLGSLCGVYCVVGIARGIERYLPWLQRPLLFWGQNSLKILCFHIIELNLMPWGLFKAFLRQYLLWEPAIEGAVILLKVALAAVCTLIANDIMRQWGRRNK